MQLDFLHFSFDFCMWFNSMGWTDKGDLAKNPKFDNWKGTISWYFRVAHNLSQCMGQPPLLFAGQKYG